MNKHEVNNTEVNKKNLENKYFERLKNRERRIQAYQRNRQLKNILEWSNHPYIKSNLIHLYQDFISTVKNQNYQLVIDENDLFNKFASMIYFMNLF